MPPDPNGQFSIRTFRVGDMGMIAARQSILYLETQGWGRLLEINVTQTTLAFLRNFKPDREQCWVAEVDGNMAGSVFLTDEGGTMCRLRLLYVEPAAHKRGIGTALVRTCLDFARQNGYRAMTLWTHSVLADARRVYAAHGFECIETAIHTEFGVPVQGEIWRAALW